MMEAVTTIETSVNFRGTWHMAHGTTTHKALVSILAPENLKIHLLTVSPIPSCFICSEHAAFYLYLGTKIIHC